MPPEPHDSPDTGRVHVNKVPDALLGKLHEATEAFGQARHGLEAALDAPTPEETPVEQATDEMRAAERQIEDVTREIDQELHKP